MSLRHRLRRLAGRGVAQPRAGDPQALAAAWLATLSGSTTPGQYQHPTLLEQLDTAVEAGWAVANTLGVTVAPIASTTAGPYAGDDTVPHALADQLGAAYPGAAATAKPRTLLQRAQQLDALRAAVLPALGGVGTGSGGGASGVVPVGETQGARIWAPPKDPTFATATGVIAAGYSRTQFESSDMNIHEGTTEIPIVDTKWGRAAKYVLPDHSIRVESMPPQNLLAGQKGVVYVGAWFVLDPSFSLWPTASWRVLAQAHGADTVSPRFALQVNHGELRVGDTKTVCPVVANTRYDWVWRMDLSRGVITVWVNGVKRVDSYKCGTSALPVYMKAGAYGSSKDTGGTVYQGPMRVGTGYGAVMSR